MNRRDALKALAISPLAAMVPAAPIQSPVTAEFVTHSVTLTAVVSDDLIALLKARRRFALRQLADQLAIDLYGPTPKANGIPRFIEAAQ